MKHMPFVIAALLCSTLAILYASPVAACQCIPGMTVPEAFDASDVVFRGVVTDIRAGEVNVGYYVTLKVYSYWKTATDDPPETIEVIEPPGWMCPSGVAYAVGREWLVLAEYWNGELHTNECLRTLEWQYVAERQYYFDAIGEPTVVPVEEAGWSMLKATFEGQ